METELAREIRKKVRIVPNFPKKGIVFRDTTPLLRDGILFNKIINHLTKHYKNHSIKYVIAKDMQGLIWAGAIANALKIGIVPMLRKDVYGKCLKRTYSHEYNPHRVIYLQNEAIKPGEKVLLVDYLMATGNTMLNMAKLVEKLGGIVAGIFSLLELNYKNPRKGLEKYDIYTLVQYDS